MKGHKKALLDSSATSIMMTTFNKPVVITSRSESEMILDEMHNNFMAEPSIDNTSAYAVYLKKQEFLFQKIIHLKDIKLDQLYKSLGKELTDQFLLAISKETTISPEIDKRRQDLSLRNTSVIDSKLELHHEISNKMTILTREIGLFKLNIKDKQQEEKLITALNNFHKAGGNPQDKRLDAVPIGTFLKWISKLEEINETQNKPNKLNFKK